MPRLNPPKIAKNILPFALLCAHFFLGTTASFGRIAAFEAFFDDAIHLEGDLYEVPAFGKMSATHYPWIHVESFGWIHIVTSVVDSTGFWMYDQDFGWMWTRRDLYPYLYDGHEGDWLYSFGETEGERWFYNFWSSDYQVDRGNPVDNLRARAVASLDFAEDRLYKTLSELTIKSLFPTNTNTNGVYGNWQTAGSSNWVSGFFPAQLWLMYDWTGDRIWRTAGEQWIAGLESQKLNTGTHDVGFMVGLPYYWAYDLTGDTTYRDVLLTASDSLITRYSSTVGAIRSWDWGNYATGNKFTVIIDNMMNLEMLLRSAQLTGGQTSWVDASIQHALTSSTAHIRSDGSTYHVVIFDQNTGTIQSQETFQGYNDESTWSRGQGWAIYGFSALYRETLDTRFLEITRKLCDYFLSKYDVSEPVPPFDFDAPGINIPRDSSAGALIASALIELSQLESDPIRAERYWDVGENILHRLTMSDYLARRETTQAILLQGSSRYRNYDQALIYGDYYFLEGLLRYVRATSDSK